MGVDADILDLQCPAAAGLRYHNGNRHQKDQPTLSCMKIPPLAVSEERSPPMFPSTSSNTSDAPGAARRQPGYSSALHQQAGGTILAQSAIPEQLVLPVYLIDSGRSKFGTIVSHRLLLGLKLKSLVHRFQDCYMALLLDCYCPTHLYGLELVN